MALSQYRVVVFTLFFASTLFQVSTKHIAVFEDLDGRGESLALNVEKCSVMPRGWYNRVSSIKTNGHCIELFDNKHCIGKAVRVGDPELRHQISNLDQVGFEDKTGSIGPCALPLTSGIAPIITPGNRLTITVYELINHKRTGIHAEVRLDTGCVNLPANLQRNVGSVDTRGKCVQLYDQSFCDGNSVQLQPNDRESAANLHFVDFLDKAVSAGPCSLPKPL